MDARSAPRGATMRRERAGFAEESSANRQRTGELSAFSSCDRLAGDPAFRSRRIARVDELDRVLAIEGLELIVEFRMALLEARGASRRSTRSPRRRTRRAWSPRIRPARSSCPSGWPAGVARTRPPAPVPRRRTGSARSSTGAPSADPVLLVELVGELVQDDVLPVLDVRGPGPERRPRIGHHPAGPGFAEADSSPSRTNPPPAARPPWPSRRSGRRGS